MRRRQEDTFEPNEQSNPLPPARIQPTYFQTPIDLQQNRVQVLTQLPEFTTLVMFNQEMFNNLQDFSGNFEEAAGINGPASFIVWSTIRNHPSFGGIVYLFDHTALHQYQHQEGAVIPRPFLNSVYHGIAGDIQMLCFPIYVLGGAHVVLAHVRIIGGQLADYFIFDTGAGTVEYRYYASVYMNDVISTFTGIQIDNSVYEPEFKKLDIDTDSCEICVALLYSYFVLRWYEFTINAEDATLLPYDPLYHNTNRFFFQEEVNFVQILRRCIQLSQTREQKSTIQADVVTDPLFIWVYKLLFIPDITGQWFIFYLYDLPLDHGVWQEVTESEQISDANSILSDVVVDMGNVLGADQNNFIIPNAIRFFMPDGPAQIAGGICGMINRHRQALASITRARQFIVWQLQIGFTRNDGREREVARRFILGFECNRITRDPITNVYLALVDFITARLRDYSHDYAREEEVMQDLDNIHFNINVQEFQYLTEPEVRELERRSRFAEFRTVRTLRDMINRVGRNRGNRAYAFHTKSYAIATKLCKQQHGEFYNYLDRSSGIADHHTLQQMQIESFYTLEELDQLTDKRFMKKPCLEQVYMAILLDLASKTNLLQEEDRLCVHSAITNKSYFYQQFNRPSQVSIEQVQKLSSIVVDLCINPDLGFCTSDQLQQLFMQSKSGNIDQFIIHINNGLHRLNQKSNPNRHFVVKFLTVSTLKQLIHINENKHRKQRHDQQLDEGLTSHAILQYLQISKQHCCDLYIVVKYRVHVYIYNLDQLMNVCSHILIQGQTLYQKPSMELYPSIAINSFNVEGIIRKFDQTQSKDKVDLSIQILELLDQTQHACKSLKYFINNDYKQYLYKQVLLDKLHAKTTFQRDQLYELLAYQQDAVNTDEIDSDSLFFSHIYKSYQSVEHMKVQCGPNLVSLHDVIIMQRKIFFATVGLLVIDIETLTIDNQDGLGNQFAYVICVFGTYRSLNEKYSLKLRSTQQTFTGLSCIQKFVTWMQEEGIILDPSNDIHNHNLSTHAYLNGHWVPFNTIVAHNGCKFDFKFILDEMSRVTNLKTLGPASNFKQLRTPELLLTDSFLLVGQSLAKFTQSFAHNVQERFKTQPTSEYQQVVHDLFTTVKQIHKGSNSDIKGLTYEQYSDWMTNSPDKIEAIYDYCRLDCSSLFFAYYVYLETVYTTPVERHIQAGDFVGLSYVFPQQVIHATAPSMTMQHYKMMQEVVLRPNIDALEIEENSYVGGLTMANISKGLIGYSLDINSSYPTAMMNKQPSTHYPADSNFHEFQTKYITNETLGNYVYMNTVRDINQLIDVSLGIDATFKSVGVQLKIESQCLYEISYKINRSKCKMSAFQCLSMQQEMLIEPTQFISHTHYDSNQKHVQGTWQWGINLLYMLKEGYLDQLYISRMIRYQGDKLFEPFITQLYNKRLVAKRDNDEVRSHICKQLMNFLYGKFGQKTLDIIHRGEPDELYDLLLEYNDLNQDSLITPKIQSTVNIIKEPSSQQEIYMEEHLVSHNRKTPYHELQKQHYQFTSLTKKDRVKEMDDQTKLSLQSEKGNKIYRHCHQLVVSPSIVKKLHSIGSLTRIASIISSYGRLQLVQVYNKLLSLNVPDKPDIKVCYGDTDSLHLCLQDRIRWEVSQSQDTHIHRIFDFVTHVQDRFFTQQHLSDADLTYGAQCLTDLILWSDIYKQINQLQIYDPTKFDSFNLVTMVDNDKLGGLKIEHVSIAQSFTAAKQYSQLQIDAVPNKQHAYTQILKYAVKGKGVNRTSLAEQPHAWVNQEKQYSRIVVKLSKYLMTLPSVSQFIQAANYVYFQQQLTVVTIPLHREWIQSFLDNIVQPSTDMSHLATMTLKQICFQFRCILGKELDSYSQQEDKKSELIQAAQSIACIFINAGSFQTTGNSVCIRSVMKTIMPSMRKRNLDITQTEAHGHMITCPYDTLFHFELMQHIQSTILRHIRKLLIQTTEFKQKIISFSQRTDSASFSSQVRLHLFTNSLAELAIKQMMGSYSQDVQCKMMQLLITKRVDKVVFDPLKINKPSPRSVNMIQLCYEVTNLYRLMFITNSSMLSSILNAFRQHLSIRTQLIVKSQVGECKTNTQPIDFTISFFLMVYCDVFNVQQPQIDKFKEIFLDIIKKFDKKTNIKSSSLDKHIRKEKLDSFKQLAYQANEICSHSLLHRNQSHELVVCNTRFTLLNMFKKHDDLRIDTDNLHDIFISISQQSNSVPYQQTIDQARSVIHSKLTQFIQFIKADNQTIYDVFQPDVEMQTDAVCINESLLTLEEQEMQRKFNVTVAQQIAFQKKLIDREQHQFNQQVNFNDQQEQERIQLLDNIMEELSPPTFVNVIRNQTDSDLE